MCCRFPTAIRRTGLLIPRGSPTFMIEVSIEGGRGGASCLQGGQSIKKQASLVKKDDDLSAETGGAPDNDIEVEILVCGQESTLAP